MALSVKSLGEGLKLRQMPGDAHSRDVIIEDAAAPAPVASVSHLSSEAYWQSYERTGKALR